MIFAKPRLHLAASLFSVSLLLVTSTVALAQNTGTAGTPAPANQEARMNSLKKRAGVEIQNRIAALNRALNQLQTIKRISDADKAALSAKIQTEIQTLQNLLAKIQADTDLATLKADVQSITKAYRVFWLFIPQVHIDAAADRINEVVTEMNNIVAKLQSRITQGGSATASLQPTLDDAKAKIADAQTQAQNAVNLVVNLQPDNGNQTILQSNLAALKQARGDIQKAMSDLKAARQDFKTIVAQLKDLRPKAPFINPKTQNPQQ